MRATIVLLLLAGLVLAANAHGGSFHEFPGVPSQTNVIRAAVATCDTWVPARSAISKVVAPGAAVNPANITGNGTLWVYLYKNCSDAASVGMELDTTLLDATGKPGWNGSLDGYTHTGSCATGGGDKYYLNNAAVPLNSSDNMLFFGNYSVPANGSVRGIGANDGNPRTSGTTAAKSYILYNANTTEPLFCCDLKVTNTNVANWTAQLDGKGKNCSEDHDHDGDGHDDHEGHDHGTNATSSPAPRSGAAAAGASVVALLGSLMLAAML